ncbi:MAG: 16S rRNA processing protein RimM [Bacteroidetes bacterium HGW-Bacteroidetes-19]|nr:MAG: 16S rRNA processing protein RimM [Bacteroidetes bacterium HGW-Bacteroidetes-20]PKP28684.1 MAG: 16S rRNA processing protein RimM [Bacteroidetes bacterium HGW-Bacteroidetes-19]
MKDFFYLGLITKPFGYKGQAYVFLDTDEPEKYSNLDAVFLNIDGEMLPYMIEDIQLRGANQAVIKFEDVDGEEIKSLMKTEIYLPLSVLPPLTGNKFYFHEVVGFSVIDSEKGNIGKIVDFIDVLQQPIMQIDFNGIEILIPAIDKFFKTVDREKREIHIDAPEGLIDVYLHG